MRRLIIGCAAAGLFLAGGALASSTTVQATIPPTEAPPIVGAWLLTVDEFPEDPPELVAFHADGTYQSSADGTTGLGSWEATGPTSINLTFIEIFPTDDEGSVGMQTIRATGEVSEDGQSFTAEFTIELTLEGAPTGEYGPGHVTGTRINVEPMGAPAGTLDDLFSQFEDGTAPAGTAPAGTAPAGTAPAGTEPAGTTPVGTEPTGTEPAGTAPAGTEPAGSTPIDTAVATTG
jgi:hypothetical protein